MNAWEQEGTGRLAAPRREGINHPGVDGTQSFKLATIISLCREEASFWSSV